MSEVENRINQYLEEIKSHIDYLSEEEIHEIISSVRSHIRDALEFQAEGQPSLEELERVLLEMDPPKSYAENNPRQTSGVIESKQISRHAILAAILLPFGIIAALMAFMPASSSGSTATTLWQWIARVTILPLGILAPFACTALGLTGVSRIRNSGGKLIGLPLAFSVGIFYPIIILNFVIFWLVASVFSAEDYWNFIFMVCLLLLLTLDFLVIKATWKAAKQK